MRLAVAVALAAVAACSGAGSTSVDGPPAVADAPLAADAPPPDVPAPSPDAPRPDAVQPDAPRPDARPSDAPDALAGARFDVAYVSELNVNQLTSAFVTGQLGVIINTGSVPLDLSTLVISGVTDDNAASFSFIFNPGSTEMLPPGQSAGDVSAGFALPLVGPLFDQATWTQKTAPNFWPGLEAHAAGSYDIHATVTLTLGGSVASLQFLLHSTTDAPSGVYFVSAKRVSAQTK